MTGLLDIDLANAEILVIADSRHSAIFAIFDGTEEHNRVLTGIFKRHAPTVKVRPIRIPL